MKHFEDLWEASEKKAKQIENYSLKERIEIIKKQLDLLNKEKSDDINSNILGSVLFQICGISDELNINTFTALFNTMQETSFDQLDEFEEDT